MNPSPLRLYSLVSFMTLVWGLNFAIAKLALRHFPPLLFSPLRAMVAAILFTAVYFALRGQESSEQAAWTRTDWLQLALLGIGGVALNQLAFVVGIPRTSVAHAGFIFATMPLQVLLLARLRGLERLGTRKIVGMVIAISGVVVMNAAPGREARGATLLGDFLVFLASLFFALYTIGSKEITRRHGAVTMTCAVSIAGAIGLLPLLIYEGRVFHWGGVSTAGWGWLLYMAVFPSVICYLIFNYALRHLPASRLASFTYAQPLLAALSGYWILNEPLSAGAGAGGALILMGVWVTTRSR